MPPPSLPETVAAVLAFDEFEVDVPGFELRRAGVPVAMEPQVFEVLAFLAQNAGRILTKDAILDHVWPERYVSEASLNSRVMSARKALGDDGTQQRYIKTVHGRGYRFVGELAAGPAPSPDGSCVGGAVTLPPFATSFVGREDELARVTALLAQPACRLLTISGPGGVGKTRLAARYLESAPEVPAVFVQAEHQTADSLISAIATSLGVQAAGGDLLEHVVCYLADREALLLVDNIEHVVNVARTVFEAILRGTRAVKILATSRVTLGSPGEWILRVDGLSAGAAARLFAERSGQANGHAVDIACGDTAEICRLVEGLPLAIELAASLTRYFPVNRIRELVANDAAGSLLATGEDLADRHRNLESLFDASLERLGVSQRLTLASLAVFEGTFESDAAETIAGAALGTLKTFVDASLVSARDGRFALHPLLRQWLLARHADEVAGLRARHAEFYSERAWLLGESLQRSGQLGAADAIGLEVTNVFAAWRWAVSTGRVDILEGARKGLFTYLTYRGRFAEADVLAEAGLNILGPGEVETRSALLVHHGWVLLRLGQTARGLRAISESLAISKMAGLPWKPGYGSDARLAVAAVRMGAGDYPAAFAAAVHSLGLAEAAGDEAGIAFASWMAGAALQRQAEFVCHATPTGFVALAAPGEWRVAEASRYIERAAEILAACDDVWLRGYVEIERGLIAGANGDRERSCGHYRTSYRLRRQLNDPHGMASALIYLCDSLGDGGQAEAALELMPEVHELLTRSGDAAGFAEALRSEGILAMNVGDLDLARRRLREGIMRSAELGFTNNLTGSLRALGDVLLLEGHEDLAGRIMACVAAHPSVTPGGKAKAQLTLGQLGLALPDDPATDVELESLVQEALRVSAPMSEWLTDAAAGAA